MLLRLSRANFKFLPNCWCPPGVVATRQRWATRIESKLLLSQQVLAVAAKNYVGDGPANRYQDNPVGCQPITGPGPPPDLFGT
jgi:hypothetical protein